MNRIVESLQVLYPEQEQVHVSDVMTLVSSLVSSSTKNIVDDKGFIALRLADLPTSKYSPTTAELSPRAKTKMCKSIKVRLLTFTNMVIKEYMATLENNIIAVTTSSNKILLFDTKTLTQLNCKNPKFANKIQII